MRNYDAVVGHSLSAAMTECWVQVCGVYRPCFDYYQTMGSFAQKNFDEML